MNLPRLYLHTVRQFFPATLTILFGISLQLSPAADPPGILNHQGRIAVNGQNHDGPGYFKFSLVKDAGGTESILWHHDGTALGTAEPAGELNLDVSKGHYAVLLGDTAAPLSMTAIPASVFGENDNVFLRIWFSTTSGSGFEQLMPDRRIVSVGYALVAKTAQGVVEGAVTEAMIADGSVTSAKLASGLATPWVSTGANISFTGGDVGLGGNLELSPTSATEGIIRSGASDTLLHTYGEQNAFFGINAGNLTMSGLGNTGIGNEALKNNAAGEANTAMGESALVANTGGERNVAIGYRALTANTAGSHNTAIGVDALWANTVGERNTAVGRASMFNNTEGWWNSALGAWSLVQNTTGQKNTAVGTSALRHNTVGNFNSAFGDGALLNNTTGNDNTALGRLALYQSTAGSYITTLGARSLPNLTSGSHNIGIGFESGIDLVEGSHNILIGNPGINTDSNSIRLGSDNQSRAFIAGIRDVAPARNDALPVVIDSDGQLGTGQGITLNMLSPELLHALGLYDVSSGLVAHFKFDGNADDASGNEVHGSEVGTVTYAPNRFGDPDSALSGTTGIGRDNYLEGNGLNLAGSDHTIAFWMRTNNPGANGGWLFRVGAASATGKSITVALIGTEALRYSFFFDDFDIPASVSDQQWHHIAVTFDQSTLERKIYIDGALDSTNTAVRGFTGDDYFNFVRDLDVTTDLDEFRFYNRILPAEEIQFLYEKVR